MTVNELLEALQDAVETDENLGDREVCIGDLNGGRMRRFEINDHAEVFLTQSGDEDEEEDRFWITVSQDRDNFYKVPSDLSHQYR